MDLPKRKRNRLKEYDYSTCGIYFITICTKDKKRLLWNVVAPSGRPYDNLLLSKYGLIVENTINNISKHYCMVEIMKYVIMPNHVHLLLMLKSDENGRPLGAPTVSHIINQMKGYCTKEIGVPIWQKLFHDHIIRNKQELEKIWEYIEYNPMRWKEDCFYIEE